LNAWENFSKAPQAKKLQDNTIIGRLWGSHLSQKEGGLQDLEIASEAADHLLAGIDTTSDTLMFLIWALSLPKNVKYQKKLIEEVMAMESSALDHRGISTAEATSKLPYVDAVIKETLRLYAPLPASEPRSLPIDTMIDGNQVPANTTVSMSPYSLHRNLDAFPDPLVFNPERWIDNEKKCWGNEEVVLGIFKWRTNVHWNTVSDHF